MKTDLKGKLTVLKRYYENENLSIFTLGEYVGFPSFLTGRDSKSYFDQLITDFSQEEIQIKNIMKIQSLFFNKSTFISDVLKHNPTIAELKRILIASVDSTRKDLICKIGVRKKMKYYITIEPEDEFIRVHDLLRESYETIVFRSSIANDMMYILHADFISYLIASKEKKEDVQNKIKNPETISHLIDEIQKNYEQIYGINNRIDLFEMGIKKPLIINDPYVEEFLEKIMEKLVQLTKEYNVSYINGNSLEKNTFLNQKNLYEDILTKLVERKNPTSATSSFFNKICKDYVPTDLGAEGMEQEEYKRYEFYEKKIDPFALYEQKITPYERQLIEEKKEEHFEGMHCYHKVK